jgi:hypothetical protein
MDGRCGSVEAWLGVGHLDAAVAGGGGAAGLVLVPPGGDEVYEEVGEADAGEEPVELVELALVEVVGEPGVAVAGELVDGGDERRADEEPQRERAQEQPRAHRLHPLGALAEEEVELADVGERLAGADEQELRDQPEHGHGHGLAAADARVPRHAEPPHLRQRGAHHGDDGQHQPDADALERGEPVRVAGGAPRHGHDEAVVDGHGEEDGADEEDGEGARRDLEGGADVAVHGGRLGHGEGGHLGVHRPEHDRRRPDRQHPRHRLHLLHVRQRRQRPLALLAVRRVVDRRMVQEPEEKNICNFC